MKNLKTILPVLLFLSAAAYLASCGKRKACSTHDTHTYYNLTDDEKARISYKGKETLVFLSDSGDTAILHGSGLYQGYEEIVLSNDPDCSEYEDYEKTVITFNGSNPKLNFLEIMYFSPSPQWVDKEHRLSINIGNYKNRGQILKQVNDETQYADTLIYKGLRVLGFRFHDNITESKMAVYHLKYGVIQIITSDNNVWTLNN